MLVHLGLLAVGIALAAVGGELFVRGTVGLAAWLRVPPGLVGATVAAFATSSPELSVGVQAAASGRTALTVGDALGSNVVNIAVVLGSVVALGTVRAARRGLRRDLLVAVVAPVVTLVALVDGRLGRAEAAVLLVIFAGWLVGVGREARRERSAAEAVLAETSRRATLLATSGGLAALIVAGRFIVVAAKGIGDDLGLDAFVVGATFVAVATSTPELATALIARHRGHLEVGIGTALGSNVFNNLWVIGLAALIAPARLDATEVVAAVAAGVLALALVVPTRTQLVPRWRGWALLGVAATYAAGVVLLG